MPLKPGSSKEVVSQNISEFHTGKTYAKTRAKFGKADADKQAIAAALSNARRHSKASGGNIMEDMVLHGSSYNLRREGMINSSIPGRTDKIPMGVRNGSYILPADIPSALGQGNTMAGGQILSKMFNSGPYGLPTMRGSGQVRPPRLPNMAAPKMPKPMFADGGQAKDDHVPIVAAGGEFVIAPEVVRDLGHGNIKAGHAVLDKFVLKVRNEHIKKLKSLPAPKK